MLSGMQVSHDTSQAGQHTRLAWACYFLLGCGFLAPWNAFITAVDYFEAVFPGRHMDRLFTVCYLPVCLVSLMLFTQASSSNGSSKVTSTSSSCSRSILAGLLSIRFRVMASFAGFTAILMAVPLMDGMLVGQAATGSTAALCLVLLALALIAILDGCCQGAIFGDAATLPPRYTHAVVGGTASSGVVISLLRLITKASLPPTQAGLRASTALYFSLAAAISLACWGVYGYLLPRLGVVAYWRKARAQPAVELSPQGSWGVPGPGLLGLPDTTWQQLSPGPGGTLLPAAADGAEYAAPDEVPLIGHQAMKDSRSDDPSYGPHPSSSSPRPCNASHGDHLLPQQPGPPHGAPGSPTRLSRGSRSPSPHLPQRCMSPARPGDRGGSPHWARYPPSSYSHGRHHSPSYSPHPAAAEAAGGSPFYPGSHLSPEPCGVEGPCGGGAALVSWQQVVERSWGYCAGVSLVCLVTLSIFPGFLAEDVQSLALGDWYPILLITLFNLADFTGKNLPFCGWQPSQKQLLVAAGVRLLFLPSFVLATAYGAHAAVVALLTAALGVTNGYLTALAMTSAPQGLPAAAAELTGNVMVLFLIGGLTVGAFAGWLWVL